MRYCHLLPVLLDMNADAIIMNNCFLFEGNSSSGSLCFGISDFLPVNGSKRLRDFADALAEVDVCV